MVRLLGLVAGGVVLLVFLLVTYVMLWPVYAGWRDNGSFADAFFADLFPYDAVLASRRWHGFGAEAWDCTFAVVSLSPNAPQWPGIRSRTDFGWQFAWGGDWQPTPAAPLRDNVRDAVGFCASRLPEGLGERLQMSLDKVGNLYVRGRVGETVFINAPQDGLAARIRYGD